MGDAARAQPPPAGRPRAGLAIRLLFHVTQLRRGGGIEAQLLHWLAALDRARFSASLSLGYATDDLEHVYRPAIPADVPVHVLGRERWLSHGRRQKLAGRLGWPGLVREEVLLPLVRKRVFRQRVERLAAGHDLIVDFDMSLARFARPRRPLVGVSHFSFAHRMAGRPRKRFTARRYFPRYDAIVTLTDAMRMEGAALFPSLAPRFRTLYPGYDRAAIEARAAEALDGAPDSPYLVSVARLDESQKDFSTLLRAYALLAAGGLAVPLVVVGEGRDRAALEALARELEVGDAVRFVGYAANPLPWVRGAAAVVLSSRYEGLPTVLVEGLTLGKVLVASDCPTGPREVLDHGRAGLLVPPGDPRALAEALGRALTDGPLRAQLQQAAARHAEVFGVPAFRARFASFVESLG